MPYVLQTGADKLTDVQKKAFDMAVTDWNKFLDKKISLREKRATDAEWITVKKIAGSTCQWVTSGRTLELGPGYIDCAAHLIGHVPGLAHEHRRSNCGTNLTVHRDRIKTDAVSAIRALGENCIDQYVQTRLGHALLPESQ